MSNSVFAESLKSPACVEILFNCLRNVEKQMKEIFVLAKTTQEWQIKDERQLNDLHDSAQFISVKFKKYEDQAKKMEIKGNLQLQVRISSCKVSILEKQTDQQKQYSRRNCFLVHRIKEVKGEATNDVIIETIIQNLDRYSILRHRKKPQNRSIKAAWRKTMSNFSQICLI